MQYLKDEVKNNIKKNALIEFKNKGFRGASMRSISKDSGTSVGNVYKYFQGKDDLYEELIGSVYHQTMSCINLFNKVELNEKAEKVFYDLMNNIMEIIDNSTSELSILLNNSEGSKYENCKISFISLITEIVTAVIKYKLSEQNKTLKDNFMIYLLSCSLVENIATILNSKDDKKEIRSLILSLIEILYEDIIDKLPGVEVCRED